MAAPDEILTAMAATFKERNAVYKDSWKTTGDAMAAFFPNGVKLQSADDFARWHLFELCVVKLARFAQTGMTHVDSIHDAAVYCSMVEALTPDAPTIETAKES